MCSRNSGVPWKSAARDGALNNRPFSVIFTKHFRRNFLWPYRKILLFQIFFIDENFTSLLPPLEVPPWAIRLLCSPRYATVQKTRNYYYYYAMMMIVVVVVAIIVAVVVVVVVAVVVFVVVIIIIILIIIINYYFNILIIIFIDIIIVNIITIVIVIIMVVMIIILIIIVVIFSGSCSYNDCTVLQFHGSWFGRTGSSYFCESRLCWIQRKWSTVRNSMFQWLGRKLNMEFNDHNRNL